MPFSETYLSQKRASFKNDKVVKKIVDIINTYSTSSFLDVVMIQEVIKANKVGQWFEGRVQLSLDFQKEDHMNISISCPEFEMDYSYEANEQFPNGYHSLRVDEKFGNSITKVFQEFVEHVKINAFSYEADKIVYDESGKPFLLVNLNYFEQSQANGEIHEFSVKKDGVHWGFSGAPQMTMSAVGGAGGTISFEAFLNGELDSFVMRGFDANVLAEAKKNVKLRLRK